jgi:hypothetical protein
MGDPGDGPQNSSAVKGMKGEAGEAGESIEEPPLCK